MYKKDIRCCLKLVGTNVHARYAVISSYIIPRWVRISPNKSPKPRSVGERTGIGEADVHGWDLSSDFTSVSSSRQEYAHYPGNSSGSHSWRRSSLAAAEDV